MSHWIRRTWILYTLILMVYHCRSQLTDDDKKIVNHALADKSCQLDNVFVECIRKCKDLKYIDTMWSRNEKHSIINHIKDKKEKGEEMFSCMVKCEVRPAKEICRQDCPHIPFITGCGDTFYDNGGVRTECKVADWSKDECKDCYKNAIEKNKVSTCLDDRLKDAYYPGHKEDCLKSLDDCLADGNVNEIEKLEECFNIKRMESDVAYCQTKGHDLPCFDPLTGTPLKSVECDDYCKKFLSKKFCQKTCDSVGVEDTPFDLCLKMCDNKTAPICVDACNEEVKCMDACKARNPSPDPLPPTITCFSHCKGRVEEESVYNISGKGEYTNFSAYHAEFCIEATGKDFDAVELIPDQTVRDKVFPGGVAAGEFDWMFTKLLPDECKEKCPKPGDTVCYTAVCFLPLNKDQKKELCMKNPFRRHSLILYAAASGGGLSLQKSEFDKSIPNDFKGYVYDPTDTATVDKFITSMKTNTCLDDCDKPHPIFCVDHSLTECTREENAKCYYECFKKNRRPCQFELILTVEFTDFAYCRWKADLSLTNSPDKLTSAYFNEKVAYDQKDKLLRPNSEKYLEQTMIGNSTHGSKGYFVFPYFVIIRAECDGGHYDEAFYRVFMHGGYPSVGIQYWPTTARQEFQFVMKGEFRSALINLKRNPDHILVPENPQEKLAPESAGCHWEICYPAFAVPLLLYRVSIFEVTVDAQDVFSSLFKNIYVSSLNNRDSEGSGSLMITDSSENSSSLVIPSMLFPKERVTFENDDELRELKDCLIGKDVPCPPIMPIDEELESFLPLDGEDFFQPQFTFRTAPVVVIAGFYSPNLLIIGDPDMNNFELVDWTYHKPLLNASVFDNTHTCIQQRHSNGFIKPMYTQVDRTDPDFPLKYYRVRLDPRDYGASGDQIAHSIFEVISLEDRFLILTAGGLVVFYGDTNATLQSNLHFKAFDKEKQRKCFKFVRIANLALMESDIVVAVTYTYNVQTGDVKIPINQEIWVGRLAKAGQPMVWEEVNNKKTDNTDLVYYDIPPDPDAGKTKPLDPSREEGLPVDELADNAQSEVERICYKAYTEKMTSSKDIEIKVAQGWCEAIDATPVVTKEETFQLLIRMLVHFVGKPYVNPIAPVAPRREVYFYVIAQHTMRKSQEQKVQWNIVSIIPRIPCTDEHKESVRNIFLFDLNYFTQQGGVASGVAIGCQNINAQEWENHIYLTRITYSRMINNHLFVYGSRLLQSTDGGETFVNLKSFPHQDSIDPDDSKPPDHRHRIEVMAFDTTGHYAFLTNRRELWIGSTGALQQIRIRPSSGHSMTQTIVSRVRGLQDGIPFSLLYDSSNKLFEMVAVLNNKGDVKRVVNRPVPVSLILRNQKINDELLRKSKELAADPPKDPTKTDISYDAEKWKLYCAFNSLKVHENYSAVFSRNQDFFFTPPRQHLLRFGRSYSTPALWAFQVATYSLAWKSFFNLNYTSYARHILDPDPFIRWVNNKQEVAKIGLLKFIRGDPNVDGVLVLPDKNKRIKTNKLANKLFRFYYLDYGIILRLELTFSIKNDANLATTDYFTQKISQIQLNVDNANGSLLQIDTEKVSLAAEASVMFKIHISVINSPYIPQQTSGQHLIPVPIVFHLIGGFGNCVHKKADPSATDSHSTIIYVGCQPATDLLFNWNATLHSIKFRDKQAHFGTTDDCYGGEFVCFFARIPMILHFDIFDISKQNYTPYEGNYIMRIVAGGYTEADLSTNYSLEEQEAYNIPGVSDVSLIWNEWDLAKSQKVDRKADQYSLSDKDPKKTSRDTVLQAGKSAIQWACHTLSPCARISPNIGFQTVYWFRLRISNRDVDNSTLCLFEREFNIMLYGFPPSPETQLLTTILFCLCMLGFLYLLFFCCRGHKRVWRASKVKMYGWYQIVKDTFPKSLKTHEAEAVDEGQTQQQKDNIIMSLQGHLKIPPLIGREQRDSTTESAVERQRLDSQISRMSSSMSLRSHFSSQSLTTQPVLNPIQQRNAATTWTDLVYEQIISKRLSAIVEKNKKMRANILRKASNIENSTVEQEKDYEKAHKRTVSKESVFDNS